MCEKNTKKTKNLGNWVFAHHDPADTARQFAFEQVLQGAPYNTFGRCIWCGLPCSCVSFVFIFEALEHREHLLESWIRDPG